MEELEIEAQGETIKLSGDYGDRIEEKFKREVNTILYQKRGYHFGFDLGLGLRELAVCSKGVLKDL